MLLLNGHSNLRDCLGVRAENNPHPLLKHCETLPLEQSSILLAGVESRLRGVRTAAGFDVWIKERFRPISARNLLACLSELAVASFFGERSDSLEFVPQIGDKPPDFKISIGSCTAFIETELLEHNSRMIHNLERVLEEATEKLQEKMPTWWFELDWYRPNLTAQGQPDLYLQAKESEEIQRNVNELLKQPDSAIKLGPFYEGKHLKVRIRSLNDQPERPTRLPEPVPYPFAVLEHHLREAIPRKAAKKCTTSRRPYILAFDVTSLGVARFPDTWSKYWQHGDRNFDLPPDIDGVVILQTCDRDGRLGCRGAIRPDRGHSSYCSDAVAVLDRLAPIDSHSPTCAQ